MRATLLVVSAFLFFGSVNADGIDCGSPKNGNEESYCAQSKFKAADKLLNDSYKNLKSKLSKDQNKILVAAQKGWLQLRDNQCALEVFAIRGTTGYNGQYYDCLTDLTTMRKKQLDSTPTDSTID